MLKITWHPWVSSTKLNMDKWHIEYKLKMKFGFIAIKLMKK